MGAPGAGPPGDDHYAREWLAAIVESSDDAIIGATLDGVVTSWNAAAEHMYGYAAAEVVGHSVLVIFPPDRGDELGRILGLVRRGERVAHYVTQRVRKDGAVLDVSVSVSPIRDADGAVAGAATVARDVTERLRALRAEGELKSELAAIVQASPDAVIGGTPGGVITSWNAGAERMYGYRAEEMIGRSVAVLIPPSHPDELALIVERLGRGERIGSFETRRVCKDGRVIAVSLAISPTFDAAGKVTGVATVARDLTERNRAVADQRALEDRVHQTERLETVGQLAGGIAHDFNNLLGAITGYADLVADASSMDAEARADVGQIQAAAQRAARLTKELLIFSRRKPVEAAPVDINGVVSGARDLVSASLGAHVEARFDLMPGLPPVLADGGQLEQVLLNLAVNARDAMPAGGVVTFRTGVVDLGDGDSRLGQGISPGCFVEIAVSDTGTGMSAEVASRAWEPFFTTKELGRGTGLGLSTVYGIVRAAGGTASIDTAEGGGTTFRLYFPAATGLASAVRQPPRAAAPARGHGEVILVVDDEPALLRSTSRILRQNGYATLEAGSGAEALALASSCECQLLLTDSVMPGMTGAALVDLVLGVTPGMRVLHMSGYSPDFRAALPAGPFIQKPFTAQALLAMVQTALAGRPGAAAG
jgi:PAS domain S-box-containing protein